MSSIFIKPVILAGGVGKRLYPLSTPEKPKQFLEFRGGQSLLQITLERVSAEMFETPLIIGSGNHKNLLIEQGAGAEIIYEEAPRNTAPAIWRACKEVAKNTVAAILPADHDIRGHAAFWQDIRKAAHRAKQNRIVCFGIRPYEPSPLYGYIKAGSDNTIEHFAEKPGRSTAKRYYESGQYFWNSGIFTGRAGVILDELEKFMDSQDQNISFDDAVMQNTDRGIMLPATFDWSDVGSLEKFRERSDRF